MMFFAALLHPFKQTETAVLRWMILAMWGGAVVGMAIFGINEEEGLAANQLHLIFIPLMTCYGLAYLLVQWNRLGIQLSIHASPSSVCFTSSARCRRFSHYRGSRRPRGPSAGHLTPRPTSRRSTIGCSLTKSPPRICRGRSLGTRIGGPSGCRTQSRPSPISAITTFSAGR